MAHPGQLSLLFLAQHRSDGARDLVQLVPVAVVVQCNKRLDCLLHGGRQIVIGSVLIGEQRVAALARHLERIEGGRARGHVEIRVVGMEVRPCVGKPDRFPVILHVGKDEDVGMLGMVELVDDVGLRASELPCEVQEVGCSELLRAKHQYLSPTKSVPDFAEVRLDDIGFGAERSELSQLHPCTASSCFIRAHANGGSASRPAASASLNSSARCST